MLQSKKRGCTASPSWAGRSKTRPCRQQPLVVGMHPIILDGTGANLSPGTFRAPR
jgi:hypothetical protein